MSAGEVIVATRDTLPADLAVGSVVREAEVQHLDRAVSSDLDIGGLQVAMNDALLVRGFEGLGDLACNGYCFFNRDCTPRDAIG